MGRRRRTYSKRKRINLIPIVLILFVFIIVAVLIMDLFSSNNYIKQINHVSSSDIELISGSINRVSEVDAEVYVNDGIIYTNQYKGKNNLKNLDEVDTAKALLEGLKGLEKDELVSELPPKQDGYYWFNINVIAQDKFLIFKNEKEFNFNLYYSIEDEKVYVKEKYYDEFSKKNNNLKFQGYKADGNFKNLIGRLVTVQLE